MKKASYTILMILMGLNAQCQMYDAKWSLGDLPITVLDFTTDSVILDSIRNPYLFFLTNANICDENGAFLYNTNGINIYDKNGDTLFNGSGINPCNYTHQYSCCGLNISQAALFIPQPGNNRYYYLIHFSNDDADSDRPATIYYSLIDKEANGGSGAAIKKNDTIFHTTRLRGGGMTACKHANGRDYWLIMGASIVNIFYKFLVTPIGILGPYAQSIGPEFPGPFDNNYSRFSLDGSKYVTGVYEGPILVMDFDRCSGEFSNPITIFNESCPSTPSCSGSSSVEISPNNRFVYVATVTTLNQYDLWASNIQDSVNLYTDSIDHTQSGELNMMQLAPNGKIYISSWNGLLRTDSLHVINNPDAKGDSCNFRYASQTTFTGDALAVPNMANYRLGALVGSGCDTIAGINSSTEGESGDISVYPNPTRNTCFLKSVASPMSTALICDALGRQVMPLFNNQQLTTFNFSCASLAPGLYFVKVTDGEGKVGVVKLVKE